MSFEKIHNAGVMARLIGKGPRDNPYYQSENLPADSAAAYRAWQMKAEAWERGWQEQDRRLEPLLDILRRPAALSILSTRVAGVARSAQRVDMAAEC